MIPRSLIRIGELARRADTTMRTIRYYEERGLLNPAMRSRGGFRLYDEGALVRLRLIRALQELNLPLVDVQDFLDARHRRGAGRVTAPGLQRLLVAQAEAIQRRLEQGRALQESIRRTLALLETCRACRHALGSPACPACPAIRGCVELPIHMQALTQAPVSQDSRPGMRGGPAGPRPALTSDTPRGGIRP